MTSVKSLVLLFLISNVVQVESKKRKPTKKDKTHEINSEEAPSLEELQNEKKVEKHQKNVKKDKKENVFAKKEKEQEEKEEEEAPDAKPNEVDWDFFFEKEQFDEEAELKMTDKEWNLMDEWNEYMADFVPEDMSTFELLPKKTETMFEPIAEGEDEYIRGAYFVAGDKNLDFYILDPKRRVIFSRRNQHEGIFRFNTTMEGDYKFVFTSKNKEETLDVTLAIHSELLNPKPTLQVDPDEMHPELESMQTHLIKMRKEVRNLQNFQRSSLLSIRSHNEQLESMEDTNFRVALLETVFLICLAGFQIWHIKGLLDNKLLI